MPIDRAVPRTLFIADHRCRIQIRHLLPRDVFHLLGRNLADLVFVRRARPFREARALSSIEAGGVLVMKVNERSL